MVFSFIIFIFKFGANPFYGLKRLRYEKKLKIEQMVHKLELLKIRRERDHEVLYLLENRYQPEYRLIVKGLRRIINEEDNQIREIEKQFKS